MNLKIRKASQDDAVALSHLSIASFMPAHGHSASKEDIDNYVSQNFSVENIRKELDELNSDFYLLFVDSKLIGYSKLMYDKTDDLVAIKNATYLSRFYLLKEYYGKGYGKELFDHNIKICKSRKQKGIWLKVWVENEKAIRFYKKMGFISIGNTDFKISETHSNPNHVLYLHF